MRKKIIQLFIIGSVCVGLAGCEIPGMQNMISQPEEVNEEIKQEELVEKDNTAEEEKSTSVKKSIEDEGVLLSQGNYYGYKEFTLPEDINVMLKGIDFYSGDMDWWIDFCKANNQENYESNGYSWKMRNTMVSVKDGGSTLEIGRQTSLMIEIVPIAKMRFSDGIPKEFSLFEDTKQTDLKTTGFSIGDNAKKIMNSLGDNLWEKAYEEPLYETHGYGVKRRTEERLTKSFEEGAITNSYDILSFYNENRTINITVFQDKVVEIRMFFKPDYVKSYMTQEKALEDEADLTEDNEQKEAYIKQIEELFSDDNLQYFFNGVNLCRTEPYEVATMLGLTYDAESDCLKKIMPDMTEVTLYGYLKEREEGKLPQKLVSISELNRKDAYYTLSLDKIAKAAPDKENNEAMKNYMRVSYDTVELDGKNYHCINVKLYDYDKESPYISSKMIMPGDNIKDYLDQCEPGLYDEMNAMSYSKRAYAKRGSVQFNQTNNTFMIMKDDSSTFMSLIIDKNIVKEIDISYRYMLEE